jgi:hypothetical protein
VPLGCWLGGTRFDRTHCGLPLFGGGNDGPSASRREPPFGLGQTNARIQQKSGALASLGFKLLGDAATPASVKALLILGLLDRGYKSLELEDLEVRLRRLEELEKNKK